MPYVEVVVVVVIVVVPVVVVGQDMVSVLRLSRTRLSWRHAGLMSRVGLVSCQNDNIEHELLSVDIISNWPWLNHRPDAITPTTSLRTGDSEL